MPLVWDGSLIDASRMGGAWLEWNEGGYDRLADQLSSEIAEGQYESFILSNDGALVAEGLTAAAERGVSSSHTLIHGRFQ